MSKWVSVSESPITHHHPQPPSQQQQQQAVTGPVLAKVDFRRKIRVSVRQVLQLIDQPLLWAGERVGDAVQPALSASAVGTKPKTVGSIGGDPIVRKAGRKTYICDSSSSGKQTEQQQQQGRHRHLGPSCCFFFVNEDDSHTTAFDQMGCTLPNPLASNREATPSANDSDDKHTDIAETSWVSEFKSSQHAEIELNRMLIFRIVAVISFHFISAHAYMCMYQHTGVLPAPGVW